MGLVNSGPLIYFCFKLNFNYNIDKEIITHNILQYMAANSYTVTNTAEFIKIQGVTGTPVADVCYSLQKNNILKFEVKASNNTFGIATLDDTNYWFSYTELIDPTTGLAYTSLSDAVTAFQGFANEVSTSYTTNFFSTKTTLGLVALQILPTAGAGWVTIKAHADNTGLITIGTSTVVAGSGYELAAGDSVSIEHDNLSEIYLKSATDTQVFYVIGSTKN